VEDDFAHFFASHYPSVRRALAVAVGDVDAAEEAAQEAFIRACVRWRRVRAMERPVAWVYVTALNGLRDEFRRAERRLAAHGRLGSVEVAVDDSDRVLTAVEIETALGLLAPRQRLAIVLRYLADLSNEDVAQAMNCSVGTVKSTINAGLKTLRIDSEDDDGHR
jgi:RNA polymerase sigma factor (sigma-70 family)